MIPQKHKFNRKYFERARLKMRLFRYEGFLFLFKHSKRSHFAVVISKKVEKKAVARNRFRRQMYALLEEAFLKKGINIELICLYKGDQIPENRQAMDKAVASFSDFYTRKHGS